MSCPELTEIFPIQLDLVETSFCPVCRTYNVECSQCSELINVHSETVLHSKDPNKDRDGNNEPLHFCDTGCLTLWGIENAVGVSTTCHRSTCDKPVAYKGGRFCGAACTQRWEAGER